MANVEVSVIIPCYNYARFLPDAVASVVAQTFGGWELIIVDDGSADDTLDIARRLMRRYQGFPIRLFHQPNRGLSAARNTGARHAAGEYLIFLDADDLLAPAYIERTLAVLRADPSAGFVYTGMYLFGHDQHRWPSAPFDLRTLLLVDYVLPHALVRRAAWEQIGGFDTVHFQHGCEDWDFWLRLACAGWPGRHLDEPLVFYRRHRQSMSQNFKPGYEWDARAQIIRKHPDLYGTRLAAWAAVRCARRGLPAAHGAADGEERELLPAELDGVPSGSDDGRLTIDDSRAEHQQASIPLAQRLVRAVPFRLRFGVKCWWRRGQLALRAAAPWLYLS